MAKRKRPPRVAGITRTIERDAVGKLYHGGVRDLDVGDRVLPERDTGVERTGPRFGGRARADRVYLTTDVDAARVYAFLKGQGDVYEVEPEGPLEPDPDSKKRGLSFQARAARVVAVVGRRQQMEGGHTPLEAARHILDQRRRRT